jgi:TRAP-type C4-dicarboxylate transport system permease small subunit
MRRFERILDVISTAAAWIAGIAVLIMALFGGLDVLSTVVLDRPISATVESTEALSVVAIFMAMGLLHKRRAYIAVDLLRESCGPGMRRALDIFSLLLMAFYFALIAWRGWESAFASLAVREFSNGLVRLPLYPSKFALAFGMTIAVLWCIVELLKGGLFREEAPNADRESS